MQFLVIHFQPFFLPPFPNVLLIAKLTNRIDKIFLQPKLTAQKHLLHRWFLPKYLTGCNTLEYLLKLQIPTC